MKREDSRRKCGTATPRAPYRGYEAQEKPRDATCTVVDILGHTHVPSRSLFPFLSFSLFFSRVKQLGYLGSVRSDTGERICIPGLAARLHACSTCSGAEVRSFVIFLPHGRLVGSEGCIRTCTASRVAAFNSEVIGISKCHVAAVFFLARYLSSAYKRMCHSARKVRIFRPEVSQSKNSCLYPVRYPRILIDVTRFCVRKLRNLIFRFLSTLYLFAIRRI